MVSCEGFGGVPFVLPVPILHVGNNKIVELRVDKTDLYSFECPLANEVWRLVFGRVMQGNLLHMVTYEC